MGVAQADGMFARLTDYGFQRSGRQAFGFYIAYLGLGAILTMATISLLSEDMPTQATINLENEEVLALLQKLKGVLMLYIGVLSFLVLAEKRLTGDVRAILTVSVGLGLAALGDALFGLIPVSYLTTRPAGASKEEGK